MSPALALEAAKGFFLEFGGADLFSCYCGTISDDRVSAFCRVENKDTVAIGLIIFPMSGGFEPFGGEDGKGGEPVAFLYLM